MMRHLAADVADLLLRKDRNWGELPLPPEVYSLSLSKTFVLVTMIEFAWEAAGWCRYSWTE